MPGEAQPLEQAGDAVGELAEERVDQDAEQDDVGLVSLLTRLGLASERDVAEALSELLDLPLLSAKDAPAEPPAPAAPRPGPRPSPASLAGLSRPAPPRPPAG